MYNVTFFSIKSVNVFNLKLLILVYISMYT